MTVTLGSVLTHFGLHTYYLDAITGTPGYWKLRLDKTLYVKLVDGYFPVIHNGYYSSLGAPVAALCQALSGHKLYLQVNGRMTSLLDLTGKRVIP